MSEPPKETGRATRTKAFYEDPPPVTLKVLCRDPRVMADRKLGLVPVKIEGEPYLAAGPTSARVAVVDYNVDLDEVFAPVPLKARGEGFAVGRLPDVRANFHFHQVNVWAIVNRMVGMLEAPRLLGRPIPWASNLGRLLLLPHAGYGRNAFYDRATGAIHFLYFKGDKVDEPVFTCLSHDIVTHELGHAVLDGLKPRYNEVSSAETAGFHEYFGDALALASSLTFREILVEAVGDVPPTLLEEVIGRIGVEFGSVGKDGPGYVRAAFVKRTMADVAGNHEEHALAQVLTNAFYEFVKWLYSERIKAGRPRPGKTRLDGHDAVKALVNAAGQATRTFFRALDYCPPVDITYGDYARAVIRADEVTYPVDETGSRQRLAEIFRDRNIPVEEAGPRLRNADLYPYDIDQISATPWDAHRFIDANRRPLGIPLDVNFSVLRLYRTRKESADRYYPPQEVIIEFVWSEDVLLAGGDDLDLGRLANTYMPLHCGGTIVFDRNGNVLHYVLRAASKERQDTLIEYVAYLVSRGRIGVGERGLGANARGDHAIVAWLDGDHVSLEREPRLRHEPEGQDA